MLPRWCCCCCNDFKYFLKVDFYCNADSFFSLSLAHFFLLFEVVLIWFMHPSEVVYLFALSSCCCCCYCWMCCVYAMHAGFSALSLCMKFHHINAAISHFIWLSVIACNTIYISFANSGCSFNFISRLCLLVRMWAASRVSTKLLGDAKQQQHQINKQMNEQTTTLFFRVQLFFANRTHSLAQ